MARRHDDGIGSHGLEQGGGSLGNDYGRSIARERANDDPLSILSDLGEKDHVKKNVKDNAESTKNVNTDSSIGDGDEGGSTPDPETLSTREDDIAH